MSWTKFVFDFIIYFLTPATALGCWWLYKRFAYWKLRNVPGPEPTWKFLAGNMSGVGTTDHWNSRLIQIYNEYKRQTPAVGIFMSVFPSLLITDPELARTILVRDFSKFHDHGFYFNEKDDPLSASLFNFEGAKWRTFRTKLSPAFSSGKIKMMYSSIEPIGDRFVEVLDKFSAARNSFDVKSLSSKFSADILASTAFGINFDFLNNPENELFVMAKEMMNTFRMDNLAMLFKITFQDLSRKLRLPLVPPQVSKFFLQMLADTVGYREQNNVNRNDFLQLLIQLKNNGILDGETGEQETERLTFNEIAAQAFVFFFAGFENSSVAMEFALYEIASHDKVQSRARKEIMEKIEKHGGRLTYEALMEMQYLDQILNESMRLHPPVFVVIRKAGEDYVIPDTNMKVDKGTQVVISNYSFHMDPDFFPDPERFDPERFSKENVAARHPFLFLPYGEGPRICIGIRFAQLQSRFAIALLLKNFKVSVDKKTKVPLQFQNDYPGWRTVSGIWLRVERIPDIFENTFTAT